MGINKVQLANGETLVDMTDATADASMLAEGAVAYGADGERIVGTMPTTTVLYTQQVLDDFQKAQARENIGAMPEDAAVIYAGALEGDPATVPLNADTFAGYTVAAFLSKIYPVGSIYSSTNSTSPANLFGGTWEQIKDTFLLAAGNTYAAGNTGGEAQHTLTINEMPNHNHSISSNYNASQDGSGTHLVEFAGYNTKCYWANFARSAGGGAAHNNMPPYSTVYMWKRIA